MSSPEGVLPQLDTFSSALERFSNWGWLVLRSENRLLLTTDHEVSAVELAAGDFELVQVSDNGVALAMVVRIGNDLQWPMIKDEPVVKLDARDYLFTLPVKDGDPLSYGVTFFPRDPDDVVFVNSLELLDDFLRENSCFSSSSSSSSGVNNGIDWKEFAPRIEDYNNVVAKAIAGGTGHIIRGMFKCSNAYTNQVYRISPNLIR